LENIPVPKHVGFVEIFPNCSSFHMGAIDSEHGWTRYLPLAKSSESIPARSQKVRKYSSSLIPVHKIFRLADKSSDTTPAQRKIYTKNSAQKQPIPAGRKKFRN
jgi:hypothetical protein